MTSDLGGTYSCFLDSVSIVKLVFSYFRIFWIISSITV